MGREVRGPVLIIPSYVGKNKELYQLFRPGLCLFVFCCLFYDFCLCFFVFLLKKKINIIEFVRSFKKPLCSDANLGWKIDKKIELRKETQEVIKDLKRTKNKKMNQSK